MWLRSHSLGVGLLRWVHVAPESYVRGPLALVKNGDAIALDIPNRKLDLVVPEAELARRRSAWVRPSEKDQRGNLALYASTLPRPTKGAISIFLRLLRCHGQVMLYHE